MSSKSNKSIGSRGRSRPVIGVCNQNCALQPRSISHKCGCGSPDCSSYVMQSCWAMGHYAKGHSSDKKNLDVLTSKNVNDSSVDAQSDVVESMSNDVTTEQLSLDQVHATKSPNPPVATNDVENPEEDHEAKQQLCHEDMSPRDKLLISESVKESVDEHRDVVDLESVSNDDTMEQQLDQGNATKSLTSSAATAVVEKPDGNENEKQLCDVSVLPCAGFPKNDSSVDAQSDVVESMSNDVTTEQLSLEQVNATKSPNPPVATNDVENPEEDHEAKQQLCHEDMSPRDKLLISESVKESVDEHRDVVDLESMSNDDTMEQQLDQGNTTKSLTSSSKNDSSVEELCNDVVDLESMSTEEDMENHNAVVVVKSTGNNEDVKGNDDKDIDINNGSVSYEDLETIEGLANDAKSAAVKCLNDTDKKSKDFTFTYEGILYTFIGGMTRKQKAKKGTNSTSITVYTGLKSFNGSKDVVLGDVFTDNDQTTYVVLGSTYSESDFEEIDVEPHIHVRED